jgi:hypothetical protein
VKTRLERTLVREKSIVGREVVNGSDDWVLPKHLSHFDRVGLNTPTKKKKKSKQCRNRKVEGRKGNVSTKNQIVSCSHVNHRQNKTKGKHKPKNDISCHKSVGVRWNRACERL